MKRSLIVLVAFGALARAGCSSTASTQAPVPSASSTSDFKSLPDIDKYHQAWPKQYNVTSCKEFLYSMTAQEQWVTSADMLTDARAALDGPDGLPPDALVDDFTLGLTKECQTSSPKNIAAAGSTLYHSVPEYSSK